MAGRFRKSMLAVGTHHSPNGVLEVTPERLRHWEAQFKKMSANNQVIPMHWDHSDNVEDLQPVSLANFTARKHSAANAVGRMTGFSVSEDGQSAQIEYQTLTPSATESMEANSVYVSPVIFERWKDGSGAEYDDCITHLDAVVHPVDHNQSPAERIDAPEVIPCAIRMGLSMDVYRMAADEEETKAADSESPPAEDPKLDENKGEGAEEEAEGGITVSQVREELDKHGIVLPEDTNGENLLDRLYTALLTANAIEGADVMADPGSQDTKVADPAIATMSLNAQNALAYAERQHRKAVGGRLKQLLDDGRCTPAEFKEREKAAGVVKLSLNDKGEPKDSELEQWIDAREPLPRGTFWSDEQKITNLSVAPQPGPVHFGEDAGDPDEIADRVLGIKK